MKNHSKYIFYAGSLRPGGGLTVAKSIIESLSSDQSNQIIVFTGSKDSSRELSKLFIEPNVQEKVFFHNAPSFVRYLISKLYFLLYTLFRNSTLISINYYIPCWCKLFVYHINLLSFMQTENDSFGFRVKRFDAKLACRWANHNAFESKFLMEKAYSFVGYIRKPQLLYIGIDPVFFNQTRKNSWGKHKNPSILVVSSMQPHKDNKTAINTLVELLGHHSQLEWRLTIVGGQSTSQWNELKKYAENLGVHNRVDFLGPQSKQDLVKLIQNSLCVLSTSLVESFCMVAIESMAAGCPVLVTNETSMPETVCDSAFMVEKSNHAVFASTILKLQFDDNLRNQMVEMGYKRASLFTQDLFKANFLELLNE